MVFKRLVVLFLIVVLSLAIDNYFFDKPHSPVQKQPTGTVIAYYENAYQAHAISLLTEAGKIEEWSCLYTLWTKESNWNPKSLNKKSGAFGIAQFMPVTWEQVGYKKTDDGFIQVEAGLAYIQRKYGGNICKALGSNLGRGWY